MNLLPTMTVRIAFASNPFDAAPTWTDITKDVLKIDTQRGRFFELDRVEAGTAVLLLKNRSGQYWPDAAGGAYYPNIKPMKRLNVQATYNAITYDVFTGFTESWTPGWQDEGGIGPIMTLTCADLIKPLSRMLLNNAGYAQELSGTRVGNVLNTLGWPAGQRVLNAGQSSMQATGTLANINAMTHLFSVEDSEMGLLFIRGDGYVIFQDRHARLKSPFTTSQATFGDNAGAGDLSYHNVEPAYEDKLIYNDVRVTRSGGTEQTVTDATSVTNYGTRSNSATGLLMTTDAEALSRAQYVLSRYKDPYLRAKNITILPQRDPTNLWPQVLGRDISDRITLKLAQGSINSDYHVEGITHTIDALNGTWTTKWELSPASIFTYWILGTSKLDIETRLAY